jgi:hypothetical protein
MTACAHKPLTGLELLKGGRGDPLPCPECEGAGSVTYLHGPRDITRTCPECDGSGEVACSIYRCPHFAVTRDADGFALCALHKDDDAPAPQDASIALAGGGTP